MIMLTCTIKPRVNDDKNKIKIIKKSMFKLLNNKKTQFSFNHISSR